MLNLKKLDRINIRILSELQRNGRISISDLAEIVGLSTSPCLKRVRQLESAGYIISYGAQLDLKKLANPQIIFTQITLTSHQQQDFIQFESKLKKIDELLEAHVVSGGFDYLLKFMTSSITEYQTMMDDLLTQDLGIIKYFSFIVLKSPIVKQYYPVKKLLLT
ncbi:Lrp/AsnC family transcriptional regulator [soil metagenome]